MEACSKTRWALVPHDGSNTQGELHYNRSVCDGSHAIRCFKSWLIQSKLLKSLPLSVLRWFHLHSWILLEMPIPNEMEPISASVSSHGIFIYTTTELGYMFFGVFWGTGILHIQSFCITSSIWLLTEDATPCYSWLKLCRVMIVITFVLEHKRLLTAMAGSPPER